MSNQLLDRSHPVNEFAKACSARLDQLADVSTWTMRPEEQRAALVDLAKAEAQLTTLRLRVLGEAERSGATAAHAAATAADSLQLGSSPSARNNAPRPKHTWSVWLRFTTPKRCRSWAGTCSR